MHFEIKSTRHTAIGTLRRGIIYNLDDRNPTVQRALKPMVESGAAVPLTEEQAVEHKAAVESLELPVHTHHDPDTVDEVAELEARLVVAGEDKAAVEIERDEAVARADIADKAVAETITRAETAEASLVEAVARAEKVEAALAEAKKPAKADKK